MKRRKQAKVEGNSDSFSISPEKDSKQSGGSGLNIVSIKHPEFRHRKPKSK